MPPRSAPGGRPVILRWVVAALAALSFALPWAAAGPASAGLAQWGETRAAGLTGTGVVVWEGGSIIRGVGGGRARPFPEQTLRLVRRHLQSWVLWRHRVGIAHLVRTAPTDVDIHYRPSAAANLCVVLAGGGDFYRGAAPAAVYAELRSYCAGRRAAGFRVIVLTVLPRSEPASFNAARDTYNRLLRRHWREFADGLVDVAADPRMGAAGDNLHRRFYDADHVHPNAAGNARMARRAARVIDRVLRRGYTQAAAAPAAVAADGSAPPASQPRKPAVLARILRIVVRAIRGAVL